MFEITVRGTFSAAHHVRGYRGDCAGEHGHTYQVEVTVSVEKLDRIGLAVDFRKVKNILKAIMKKLDHQNLNRLAFFKQHNATAEWVAVYLHTELKKKMKGIHSVCVWEGDENSVTYRAEE